MVYFFYRFLICYTLLWYLEIKLESKHGSSYEQLFILRLYIVLSKLLISCVTMYKVAWMNV